MDARERFIRRMLEVLGPDDVISEREQLCTYECDGLTSYKAIPSLVVMPETTEQVQGAVRVCNEEGVPFVARGSGTGLSGGALPVETGVLIVLSRMRRILEVDIPNQRVVVEPGVINLWVTEAVSPEGYYEVGLKLSILPTELPRALAAIAENTERHRVMPRASGHAGVGVLWVALSGDEAAMPGLIGELRTRLEPGGGTLVVVQAPLSLKQSVDV